MAYTSAIIHMLMCVDMLTDMLASPITYMFLECLLTSSPSRQSWRRADASHVWELFATNPNFK